MFRRSSFNFFDFVSDRNFVAEYLCYPVAQFPEADRSELDKGGKILLPPHALEALTKYHISSPMLFQLKNSEKNRYSHAGVLEFVAEEGKCYLPEWLMKNLILNDGEKVDVSSVTLPIATFSKFQPLSADFLDITNPKAVLENALRNFACLTKDDVIAIHYNKKIYELLVLETKPDNAVSIIECDMNVEFAAPVGYEDDQNEKNLLDSLEDEEADDFVGQGQRLDGKKKRDVESTPRRGKKRIRGVPDPDYEFGSLSFNRQIVPITDRTANSTNNPNNASNTNETAEEDDGFEGKGSTM